MASIPSTSGLTSGPVPEDEDINLHVRGQIFTVKKVVLAQHSDYFKAMFVGNYCETIKQDLHMVMVDKTAMAIVIKYMYSGDLDLSQFSITEIKNLAICADYLQMIQLKNLIESDLDLRLTISNFSEIFLISKRAALLQLEMRSAMLGLLSFKEMKPQYIPTVEQLFWYLSHPCLNTMSELDVFKFGYKWILCAETWPCPDLLLVVLASLDMTKLKLQNLKDIALILSDSEDSLAYQVVDCLKMLVHQGMELCMMSVVAYKKDIVSIYSTTVYGEVFNMVNLSHKRTLQFTPIVPMLTYKESINDYSSQTIYTFSTVRGFKQWLEAPDSDLWGWSLTAWGPSRLVQVCGEHGRGTGKFMRDVRVFDLLKCSWISQEVQLPSRRHAGVTVCGDLLYIVGGVGGFRVVEDSGFVYDLKTKKWKEICHFPDAIQSPAICTHYGAVYAAGQKNVYRYENAEAKDYWSTMVETEIRLSQMASFKEYIYCSQNYFTNLYRFRPGIDSKLEMVSHFRAPPVSFCNLGNVLLACTSLECDDSKVLKMESFIGPCMCKLGTCCPGLGRCGTRVLWSKAEPKLSFNEVAGSCALVTSRIQINVEVSKYHKNYLTKYGAIKYNTGAVTFRSVLSEEETAGGTLSEPCQHSSKFPIMDSINEI